MFDYNRIEPNNVLSVSPLSTQSGILANQLKGIYKNDDQAQISLVCHSQGCIAAAILSPTNIYQAIFLTPPVSTSSKRFEEHFNQREGVTRDNEGHFLVPRRDGTVTKVPRAFIDELDNYSVPQLFKEFSKKTQLNVIVAKEDKVLGKTDFNYLTPTADLLLLPGDHNFSGQARPGLMSKLQKIFS